MISATKSSLESVALTGNQFLNPVFKFQVGPDVLIVSMHRKIAGNLEFATDAHPYFLLSFQCSVRQRYRLQAAGKQRAKDFFLLDFRRGAGTREMGRIDCGWTFCESSSKLHIRTSGLPKSILQPFCPSGPKLSSK